MWIRALSLICFLGKLCINRAELGQGDEGGSDWSSLFRNAILDVGAVVKNENVSDACKSKVEFYLRNLDERERWALEVLDSVEKLPSGILKGNSLYWPGKFDECLEITELATQYCLISVRATGEIISKKVFSIVSDILQRGLVVGTCVPTDCNSEDIITFVKTIANFVPLNISVEVDSCQTSDNYHLDSSAIAIIIVLTVFAILLASSTFHELYARLNSKPTTAVLSVFSVLQNGTALFSTKPAGGIGSLHGLRFLSMAWIILLHTFSSATTSWNNFNSFLRIRGQFFSEIVLNGNVAVDTFYCMSGLLVSYLFMKKMKGAQKFDVVYFYVHRYVRLTPVYAIVIGVAAGLLPFFGSGPRWSDIILQSNACKTNWWLNLLYVSNIFNTENMCQSHCWFLAADMQMYLVSPLMLYPLYKYPRLGWSISIIVIILSCSSDAILTYVFDLPATTIVLSQDSVGRLNLYYLIVYMQAYTRLGPYVIGILTGYVLCVNEELQRRMTKTKAAIGWILMSACNLSVLFGLYGYVADGTTPSLAERCLYSSLSRTAWTAGIAYIVVACAWGYGGFVNRLLSWNGFLPLGRLTYCAYIVHYNILLMFYATRQSTFYYDFWIIMYIYSGTLIFAYLIAVPFTLTFEVPLLKLEKLLLHKKGERILKKNGKRYDSTEETTVRAKREPADSQTGISNAAFEEELNYDVTTVGKNNSIKTV